MTPKQIPPFRLDRVPLDDNAAAVSPFRWAGPEVGTRNRLGGSPDSPLPRCPFCNEEMSFYGQLDSISDEYVIADVGVIQAFLCFSDGEVLARIESG